MYKSDCVDVDVYVQTCAWLKIESTGPNLTQLESFIVSIGNRIEAIGLEATSSLETKAGSKIKCSSWIE